ncbi:MAG: anthranilate phosphoribosyltransferase [Calditerrivibrio sp.]|nr:anthranilate phosphoribosyltransferase [Calditerrivibrio sp.]MCA1933661.1 anthranilate phosphoribosyltransferase [Calditerrivibrio sp.]
MLDIIKKVNNGGILTKDEAKQLFSGIIKGELSEAQIASVLISMKSRVESSEEIAGAVESMMEEMIPFEHNMTGTIDTCGTGGDGKSTVNISTAVSINLASMGYPVIKHGNVAQTGKVGSADILNLLDMPCKLEKNDAQDFFNKHNFVFLFAPFYHPALKNVAKIRKELMTPTIFNFIGPLANPAKPDYQIIGISRRSMLKTYTDAALLLGKKNMLIYSSDDGFDEISTSDITKAYLIRDGEIDLFFIDPAEFFEPFPLPQVNDQREAVKLFIDGIKGEDDKIAKIFAINTSVALYLLKKGDIKEHFQIAYENIKSGNAYRKLESLRGI